MTDVSELKDSAENLLRDWAPILPAAAVAALRDIVDRAFLLGQELHGEDFTDGAGPDETCGCGEDITWYDGEWMHIANPALRGTDDHQAEPDAGYYIPEGLSAEDTGPLVRCTCTLLFYSEQARQRHLAKTLNHGAGVSSP